MRTQNLTQYFMKNFWMKMKSVLNNIAEEQHEND